MNALKGAIINFPDYNPSAVTILSNDSKGRPMFRVESFLITPCHQNRVPTILVLLCLIRKARMDGSNVLNSKLTANASRFE